MSKKAHIYIYGAIAQPDPFAEMFGVTDQSVSAKDISDQLNSIKEKEIDVHIKSNGGSVSEGYAIHDLLVNSGKKINTIGEGEVRSIATVVFLAGSDRSISPNCDFTIHNPWIDPICFGPMEGDDLMKIANDMKDEEEKLAKFYADKTGKSIDDIKAKMSSETTFSAQETVDMGFATRILEPVKAARIYSDKIYAYIKPTKPTPTMSNKILKMASSLLSAIKGENVKADMTTLDNDKVVYHDGPLGAGTACFEDEELTKPCAAGEYKTKDGLLVTLDDKGVVLTVVDANAAVAELDQVKKALADKEAEIKAKDEEINALKNPPVVATTDAEKALAKELADKKAEADALALKAKTAEDEIKALKENEKKTETALAEMMAEVKNLQAGIKAPGKGAQNFKGPKGQTIPQANTEGLTDYAKTILARSK